MDMHARDGALALVALAVCTGVLRVTRGLGALFDPVAVTGGLAGALALEVVFLSYPEQLLAVWERPESAVGATLALLAGGVVALWVAPWLLAAVVWGLLTYLVLLGSLLLGLGNPVAVLLSLGRRRE